MKGKSILCMTIICLLFAAGNVFSQGRGRYLQMQNTRIDTLKKHLALTDKQVEEVKNILSKSREAMMNRRGEFMGDPDAMMNAINENSENTNKDIEKILTAEQKKKFQKIKEEWRKQREERMKAMRGRFNNQ